MPRPGPVHEMRLVVTAIDYDEAVRFYRDVLGLPERAAYASPDGRVTILEAGLQRLLERRGRPPAHALPGPAAGRLTRYAGGETISPWEGIARSLGPSM